MRLERLTIKEVGETILKGRGAAVVLKVVGLDRKTDMTFLKDVQADGFRFVAVSDDGLRKFLGAFVLGEDGEARVVIDPTSLRGPQ